MLEILQLAPWYRRKVRIERFAHYCNPRARVVQHVLIVSRLEERVHGNRNSATLDRPEEADCKFRAIEQQQENAFLYPNSQPAQGVSKAIYFFVKFLIRDRTGVTLNCELRSALLVEIPVDKVSCSVEMFRN